MLIHPGDAFSTHDVYVGLRDGLIANGCQVEEARLDVGLDIFSTAIHLLRQHVDAADIPHWAQDAFALAAPRIIQQAIWTEPDLVIAVTGLKLHPSVPLTLRKLEIPVVLLCTETPYAPEERQIAQLYDHVFTHERKALGLFRSYSMAQKQAEPEREPAEPPKPNEFFFYWKEPKGATIHYLPHAYHIGIHTPGPAEPDKQSDVYFVGTAFPERRELFEGVNWTGIHRVIHGALWQYDYDTLVSPEAIANGEIDPWAGCQDNTEVVHWYRSARICLNHHRTSMTTAMDDYIDNGAAESLGPRTYEIAACGAFQLCDDSRPEIYELFGDAAATYRAGDSADLEAKIRYWLEHDEERQEMARRQHAAVRDHHWQARAAQLLRGVYA